jgi:hypothetical protein
MGWAQKWLKPKTMCSTLKKKLDSKGEIKSFMDDALLSSSSSCLFVLLPLYPGLSLLQCTKHLSVPLGRSPETKRVTNSGIWFMKNYDRIKLTIIKNY